MKKLFKNRANEIRSGWKIGGVIVLNNILKYVMYIIFAVITGLYIKVTSPSELVTVQVIYKNMQDFVLNSMLGPILYAAIGFASVLLAVSIFLKKIDKKKFSDIGLISIKSGFKHFIVGLLLGAISISFVFFLLLKTDNIFIINASKPNFLGYIFYGLIGYIAVGIGEELLNRGYCITVLNQMKKPWVSIFVSAIIFASMHLLNSNFKPLGIFNAALVGILFGYMYMKTKNLWMPIGYHIAWNYFEGSIYGFHVSGFNIPGIFDISILKDNYLTGGAFGPEAGILTTIVIVIGLLIVWKLPAKNKSEHNILVTHA